MKTAKRNRSVADKIEAVLALHIVQNPEIPLTVSALARKAGVSRANLYVSHPDILAKLPKRAHKAGQSGPRASGVEIDELRGEVAELKRVNKALLLLNVELRREIARLNRRLTKTPLRT